MKLMYFFIYSMLFSLERCSSITSVMTLFFVVFFFLKVATVSFFFVISYIEDPPL